MKENNSSRRGVKEEDTGLAPRAGAVSIYTGKPEAMLEILREVKNLV